MKKLKEIKWNECKGTYTLDRSKEELKDIAELFKKTLKLTKYAYYIDTDIHFSNRKKYIDIIERNNNKFTVVKYDAFGNRNFSYYELYETI